MPTRSSRRLAGCIAIELLLAAGGWTAADFRAGAATAGQAKAVVLKDRRGAYAVFAEADFEIPQAVADFVAARLVQTYDLPRPSLLLRGAGGAPSGPPAQPEDLLTATAAALGTLEPAEVRIRGANLSVTLAGHCHPIIGDCAGGALVHGPIRAALQMVEPTHGLLQRADPWRAYPVQAIALGKDLVIVALSGPSQLPREFPAQGLLFVSHANDSAAPPDDARIREAIRQVLSRVGAAGRTR